MGDPFRWGWYDIGINALQFLCPTCAAARAEQGACNFVEERTGYERTDCRDCGATAEAVA